MTVINKTRVLNEVQVLPIFLTKKGRFLGKAFQFTFCLTLLLPVNKQTCYNGFPYVHCFSTFVPFQVWLVHVSIIASSDECFRSFMCWVFIEEVKTLYLETF